MERTHDLEATISFHESKLAQKNEQLKEKEENENLLKQENEMMLQEIEEKNQEILQL